MNITNNARGLNAEGYSWYSAILIPTHTLKVNGFE